MAFKPTPSLSARLRLTTKQVNGGYYKGTRTGSMGAHTPYGNYLIDFRKVRHFAVPDALRPGATATTAGSSSNLSSSAHPEFQLTPFVTQQMEETPFTAPVWDEETGQEVMRERERVSGRGFLEMWAEENAGEYEAVLESQREEAGEPAGDGEDKVLREEDMFRPAAARSGAAGEEKGRGTRVDGGAVTEGEKR
jgi:large subunit ribosomal protein L41